MKKLRCIDYRKKSAVLKTGICQKLKKIDKASYLLWRDGIVPPSKLDESYTDILFQYGTDFIQEARKINTSEYRRMRRLKERIETYLSMGYCTFLTLTFSNEVLERTTEDSRRDDVRDFLKSISDYYVANIDYGVDDRYSKREHYHAVVVGAPIDVSWWQKNRGHTWRETIYDDCSDAKISKYIAKLTNHAIKDSTKRQVYIYSRSKL